VPLLHYLYNKAITSVLNQYQVVTDFFHFCDTMNSKVVTTTPITHSWLEEEIRFSAKDVVEP
jgi:hypothetical protein